MQKKIFTIINSNHFFPILILLFSIILRLYGLSKESIWIDEAYSLELSSRSFSEITIGTANDQHPPFYYYLLKIWMFGTTNLIKARYLSVLLGVINIIQIFYFSRYLFKTNKKNIYIITSLIAISPIHIWYSQEIRMYILLLVLTTASTFFFTKLISENYSKKQFAYYVILNLFSIYTHNYAIFIILFQFLFTCFLSISKKITKKMFLKIIFGFFFVLISYSPWIIILFNQILFHKITWIDDFSLSVLSTGIFRLISGYPIMVIGNTSKVILLFIFGIFVIFGSLRYLFKNKVQSRTYLLLLTWGFIPLIIISLFSIKYPIFQNKQLLILLFPMLSIIILLLNDLFPKKISNSFIIILLCMNIISTIYQHSTINKDDWLSLVDFLKEEYQTGDILFYNPAAIQYSIKYNSFVNNPFKFQAYPRNYDIVSGGWAGEKLTIETSDEIIEDLIDTSNRVWYLEFAPEFWDPNQYLNKSFISKFGLPILSNEFGNVKLSLYEY